ncbi:hypothetical protein M2139_001102 [Enterococcus sp. PF1-24]|uniref:hypothetical protein n=1 Tax=unclassified Enterococcus TaxID=2608891 RepID=UPI002475A917|nr:MULTISPECIES: hypothetical protein [unclassified Enterococcus]MDH6364117.1 hypothetical protein [Enterococcus sp. PFB1-1]MDH6401218.1 hypothetical protein [Enterococcus sp. PF1-24]
MKTLKRKILIIGGSGALGKELTHALNDVFGDYLELYIGDYDEKRGMQTTAAMPRSKFCLVDGRNLQQVQQAIVDIDCVIVAFRQKEPVIQKACFQEKVICIDLCAFQAFADKVQQLDEEKDSLSVVMAGFFPGLSGVIATSLAEEFETVEKVSVGLLQNSQAQAGSTGIMDMLKIINMPLNEKTKGFTNKREMTFFHSKYPVYEIQHDEKVVLQKKLQLKAVHYWTSWNNPKLNNIASWLVKRNLLLKFSKLFIFFQQREKKADEERAYLNIKVTGTKFSERHSTQIEISAKSDYSMTAFYVAMIADKAFISKKVGVCYPFEMMELSDFNYFDYDSYFKIKRYERELS